MPLTTKYSDTVLGARSFMTDYVDETIMSRVEADLSQGLLRLVPDPEVAGCWGLKWASSGQMEAILYLGQEDFEGFESYMG